MFSMTFADLPILCYQEPKLSYTVSKKETTLLSGDIHVNASTKKRSFPRSYSCYTDDYANISNLTEKIGIFDDLVIAGVGYSNCYISNIGSIYEISRGSGKWTYEIEFSQADSGSSIFSPNFQYGSGQTSDTTTSTVTQNVYLNEPLSAGDSIDSTVIDLTNASNVSLFAANTGSSTDLVVEIYGDYSSNGLTKYPVFVCVLDTTITSSGAPLIIPPNYLFVHVKNNDLVNSTTFSITITKTITG